MYIFIHVIKFLYKKIIFTSQLVCITFSFYQKVYMIVMLIKETATCIGQTIRYLFLKEMTKWNQTVLMHLSSRAKRRFADFSSTTSSILIIRHPFKYILRPAR